MRFKSRQIMLAAVSLLALSMAVPAAAQTTGPAVAPSDPWAQTVSDVPVDPAVRFGQLPNGMRYALMHARTPPGQAGLRLRIDAGSLMENDNQLGLAHFMEHMAFNGTQNIPENELLAILERLGLAFGADTNAFTGFDQTAYTLDLPRTNDETVDAALRILREQVSRALMNPADIDSERGVIEGEQRLRDSPQLRASLDQLAFLMPGQKVAHRFPIGDLEIIRTAPRERFVEFYRNYYRPERATFVAVGDFDVDVMERKIRAEFGDWQGIGPAGPEPDLGVVLPRQAETKIVQATGLSESVSLSWSSPPRNARDTVAERREGLLRWLGFAVLNRRLGELSRLDDAPIINGSVSSDELFDSVRMSTITASYLPGRWERALQTIDQERRRLVEFGVTDAELQREIENRRSGLETQVAAAATRWTTMLAGNLLNSVNDNYVFTSPQTDLDLFNAAVANLSAEEVNGLVREAFRGNGPLLMVSTPDPIEGGEARVAQGLASSLQVAVTPAVPQTRMEWPYTDFGTPGVVTSTRELAVAGATVVTFENGVELTFKQTDFRDEEVGIMIGTGLGEQAFSPTEPDARQSAITTIRSGGLTRMNVDEMSLSLTGRRVGGSLDIGEDRFILSGGSAPHDFELEMQLLAATLTDSAFRAAPWNQMKSSYPGALLLNRSTPGGVFNLEATPLLAGGDLRKTPPPAEVVAGWAIEPLRDDMRRLLAEGPLRITIVGDVTLEQAIAVTATTFGALPKRPPLGDPAPGADQRRFPAPAAEPVVFKHDGPPEQALGFLAWPTTDSKGDKTEARRISLLSQVVRLRALAEIRERQALAYSPGVGAVFSNFYPGYGYLSVQAATTPQNLPAFYATVDAIAQDLRDNPITLDELNRARAPVVEATRRSMESNNWWMLALADASIEPGSIEDALSGISDYEAITPADIQALAQQYLRPESAWRATVVSKDAAPAP